MIPESPLEHAVVDHPRCEGQRSLGDEGLRSLGVNYRRAAPATKISTVRLLHREQTSLARQSRSKVSLPYCRGHLSGVGLDLMRQPLHQTISRTWAVAAAPSVIGGSR